MCYFESLIPSYCEDPFLAFLTLQIYQIKYIKTALPGNNTGVT